MFSLRRQTDDSPPAASGRRDEKDRAADMTWMETDPHGYRSDGDGAPSPTRSAGCWQEVGQGAQSVMDRPGALLTATLGSCVAICLHDPVHRQGGMNHIYQCVQPGPLGGAAIVAEAERLVNALMRRGARRQGLVAQVVGGAHTLARGRDVGAEIAGVCLLYLAAEDIRIVRTSVGGTRPRRAVFDPLTGSLSITHPRTAIAPADFPRARPPEWELF